MIYNFGALSTRCWLCCTERWGFVTVRWSWAVVAAFRDEFRLAVEVVVFCCWWFLVFHPGIGYRFRFSFYMCSIALWCPIWFRGLCFAFWVHIRALTVLFLFRMFGVGMIWRDFYIGSWTFHLCCRCMSSFECWGELLTFKINIICKQLICMNLHFMVNESHIHYILCKIKY